MYLKDDIFRTVVESTPLVSIDLIVRDQEGRVLLGERNNRPAKSMWFVPGGRVLKGEKIDEAFRRLVLVEMGLDVEFSQARYVGLYDHIYSDSIWGSQVSTHYVVNAFELSLSVVDISFPEEQHSRYAWFAPDELLRADNVHDHTKWYFLKGKEYS